MSLNFLPIAGESALSKRNEYQVHLAECLQIASDYSFLNLWGWADAYGLEWAWEKNLIWIRQTVPEPKYWAPVGLWNEIEWQRVFESIPRPSEFIRVPESLLTIWQKSNLTLSVSEARGHWDYLYAISELKELKGNRYHKKKNLINQFYKKYNPQYVAFDPSLVDQALALQTDWCLWRDCESSVTLEAENRVIEKTLAHWEKIGNLIGGGISLNGRLSAYTVAEPISNTTIVIHFEKADPEITGAYQAINQMFLSSLPEAFSVVNREQDLDDPGLRKAKLSYHPIDYLKKFTVVFS
jgi:uncharacterized protein